ncbi:MAG: hypothetical protein H6Q85_1652, partial [candidate division NC10 bacterium]|nr:hypothetical protein [candidate division NC10 bacterium]
MRRVQKGRNSTSPIYSAHWYEKENVMELTEIFGSNVFNDRVMK